MKSKKQQDLWVALQDFYQQPVAKVSLELFLSIGLIIFFAVFAIRPTLATMSDLLKEIEDKKELESQLQQKLAALATVQRVYLNLEDQLYALDQALPNTPQVINSLKVIEKTASDLNLVITGLNLNEIPLEIDESEKFDPSKLAPVDVPVGVTVRGTYPIIRQFVENLINYRRTYSIDTIVFNTQETRGSTTLEAKITINMPYFSDKTKLTKSNR